MVVLMSHAQMQGARMRRSRSSRRSLASKSSRQPFLPSDPGAWTAGAAPPSSWLNLMHTGAGVHHGRAEQGLSFKAAAKGLTGKMDCVILNAGKMLGGKAATDPTDEGYGTMFAMHVLGRGPALCNFAPVGSTRL